MITINLLGRHYYKCVVPKIYVDDLSGCWPWLGCISNIGYATLKLPLDGNRKRRTTGAYRYIYTKLKSPIPEGMEPDHICQNKACVNPQHIEIVTHRENILRAYAGYCRRGHKLTAENSYTPSDGKRRCKKCIASRRAKSYSRGNETGVPTFAEVDIN